jgi:two-component system KDP operon response regulator KdpE
MMASPAPLVLLIEDEVALRRTLRVGLRAQGYSVVEAGTAHEGLAQVSGRNPDVIVLDLGLPDGEGLDLAREVRRSTRTPIIILSARGREQEKVRALDLGADDYVTKPVGIPELAARIRVALRHAATTGAVSDEGIYHSGGLRVDLIRRRVHRDGVELHLTPTEYKLLALLIQGAGRVLTHHQLLQGVWGPNREDQRHYLRVYMAQLRRKIESDPAQPRYLFTEPGVGYRLREER